MASPEHIMMASVHPNTSLALVPPKAALAHIQPLRSLYDPAVTKWVPHINIFYPFVNPESLPAASEIITSIISDGVEIEFDRAEVWKNGTLVVLRPSVESEERFEEMYNTLLNRFPALGKTKRHNDGAFKMHMTIGHVTSLPEGLRLKAEKLARSLGRMTWNLASMQRERSKMRLIDCWGSNNLFSDKEWQNDPELLVTSESHYETVSIKDTYEYGMDTGTWGAIVPATPSTPKNITISTYNCMCEPSHLEDTKRMQQISRNMLETKSAVICLQEVWDGLLDYLLNHTKVGERFTYVSHSPEVPLVYTRNIIILSEIEFSWEQLTVTKFKPAMVALFGDLVVANIHAPAFLNTEAVEAKARYYDILKDHLDKKFPDNPCVITGDFNLPTESDCQAALKSHGLEESDLKTLKKLLPEDEFQDAWTMLEDEESGATFDPSENEFAEENMTKLSRLPHGKKRYDRLLIRKAGAEVQVRDVSLFGFPRANAVLGSDHWGLSVALKLGDNTVTLSEKMLPLPEVALNDADLIEYLQVENAIPTVEDRRAREEAIDALKRCLRGHDEASAREGTFQMELTAVGSFGLGTYSKDSDIDCLVVGNITSKTFWKIAKLRVKRWTSSEMRVVRFVNATIPMMILVVNGVQVDLQYCTAVRVVEAWSSIATLPADDPLFSLPVATLRKLQAYRDMNHLLSTLPNLSQFRTAYRLIKLWAVKRGIYSSKFGYIGGVHITLLLSRICLLLPATASVAQILKVFFSEYANWQWEKEIWQPNLPKKIRHLRAAREKMAILTIHAPAVNVALNATKHTVAIMSKEFARANEMMETGWEQVCGESVEEDFLRGFARYVKVDVQFWGTQKAKGRGLVGWVESRCVNLLADLATKVPTIDARIWPKRFHEVSPSSSSNTNDELRGFYLIGLTYGDVPEDDKRSIEATFNDTLRSFEDTIRNPYDGKFDEKDSWVQVVCVKSVRAEDAGNSVQADATGFWDTGLGADATDSDDESDDGSDDAEDEDRVAEAAVKVTKKAKSNVPTPKLRPSHEILSRIRWDASYDSSDYVVGYEDRFRGVLEMPVDNWKTEMTDEEFVPMHRIVWFRKRSDGIKIWDRENKIDLVFGSGLKQGEKAIPL